MSAAWNRSLSARRAWIEIIDYIIDYATDAVALRKESVDRNHAPKYHQILLRQSLSARRAWIEIDPVTDKAWALESLSARRAWIEMFLPYQWGVWTTGRSPQGERG